MGSMVTPGLASSKALMTEEKMASAARSHMDTFSVPVSPSGSLGAVLSAAGAAEF